MFVIRVADDTGEWTIARRFRHFESLHRSLRGCAVLASCCLVANPPALLKGMPAVGSSSGTDALPKIRSLVGLWMVLECRATPCVTGTRRTS